MVHTAATGRPMKTTSPAVRCQLNWESEEKTESSPLENLPLGAARGPRLLRGIARFFAVALHFAQGIDWLVLRFVIRPRQHLAEEPHRDELHSADKERHGQKHKRPVLRHHRRVVHKFLDRQE